MLYLKNADELINVNSEKLLNVYKTDKKIRFIYERGDGFLVKFKDNYERDTAFKKIINAVKAD